MVPPPRAKAGRLDGATGDCFACNVRLPVVVTAIVPTVATADPLRLKGMGKFVTVRGGGYFFMPGKSAVSFLIGGR